ncbi:hypothetical protein HanIR_Chr07g0307701 [Helianthus annuus]|nr:hypothetical protein HanIR_Chr07g0307701 [Helianthus annuus]
MGLGSPRQNQLKLNQTDPFALKNRLKPKPDFYCTPLLSRTLKVWTDGVQIIKSQFFGPFHILG